MKKIFLMIVLVWSGILLTKADDRVVKRNDTTLVRSGILLTKAENKQFFGVQIGYTQPVTRLNLPVSGKEKELTPTIYNGFKVGVVYDATIVAGFGYSIGLNYTFGAHESEWKQTGIAYFPREKTQEVYHQLEIPVDWQYKFEIAKRTWLMLYTGPTLQCGLAFQNHTFKQRLANAEPTIETVDRYTMDNNFALQRINVTWGVGAGIQYERYFVRGGYDFGIINPYKAKSFHVTDVYNPYTRGRFDQWQIKLGIYL